MILAIDPSLSCTGYAVLNGTIIRAMGKVTSDGDGDAYERACSISNQLCRELEPHIGPDTAAVVVEAPQIVARGLAGKRSAATAPNYGIVVGVVTRDIHRLIQERETSAVLLRPSATVWTAGLPGTRKDPKKRGRVQLVSSLYGLGLGALGSVTDAGNIADAILLARWGQNEVKEIKRRSRWQAAF